MAKTKKARVPAVLVGPEPVQGELRITRAAMLAAGPCSLAVLDKAARVGHTDGVPVEPDGTVVFPPGFFDDGARVAEIRPSSLRFLAHRGLIPFSLERVNALLAPPARPLRAGAKARRPLPSFLGGPRA